MQNAHRSQSRLKILLHAVFQVARMLLFASGRMRLASGGALVAILAGPGCA